MISDKVSSQVTRRLDQLKDSLHFQIQNASIQNTLDTHGRANLTVVDRESNGIQESSRRIKTWKNCPKSCFAQDVNRKMSRESSVDSNIGDQNRHNYKLLTVPNYIELLVLYYINLTPNTTIEDFSHPPVYYYTQKSVFPLQYHIPILLLKFVQPLYLSTFSRNFPKPNAQLQAQCPSNEPIATRDEINNFPKELEKHNIKNQTDFLIQDKPTYCYHSSDPSH